MTAIPLRRPLPSASCDRPGRQREGAPGAWSAERVRGRQRLPPLLGLAPGGVFHAIAVAGNAVRSYRTISPLPPDRSPGRARRCIFCGTVPGVAPAGRYPAPYLHGARTFLSPSCGERPSGRLAKDDVGNGASIVKARGWCRRRPGRLGLRNCGEPDRSGELGFDVAGKERINQRGRVPGSCSDCRWTGHIGQDERVVRGVGRGDH